MASITVISPAMEAHLTGCADIAKTMRLHRGEQHANVHEGATLLEAILDADEDMADAFGETPYQKYATHWTVELCDVKPCLMKEIAKAGIEWTPTEYVDGERAEGSGRPFVREGAAPEAPAVDGYGICNCGCGGRPKGKKSRFLPGHDMRVKGA